MRANINLRLNKSLELPIQYNHILHAVLLKWINDNEYQKFIHDTGYEYNNRRYKLYTFSKLQGKFKLNKVKKTITYFDRATLAISCVDDKFLKYVLNNILLQKNINIYNNNIEIENIEVSNKKIENNKISVYTKSPITVYSTFKTNGKNKTYYYNPFESEFSDLIKQNLIKKYAAFYGTEPKSKEFSIELLNIKKPKQSIVLYKNTVIKGWNGEFLLKGSLELLNMAYNSGLGSKNSQGFGYIELKK